MGYINYRKNAGRFGEDDDERDDTKRPPAPRPSFACITPVNSDAEDSDPFFNQEFPPSSEVDDENRAVWYEDDTVGLISSSRILQSQYHSTSEDEWSALIMAQDINEVSNRFPLFMERTSIREVADAGVEKAPQSKASQGKSPRDRSLSSFMINRDTEVTNHRSFSKTDDQKTSYNADSRGVKSSISVNNHQPGQGPRNDQIKESAEPAVTSETVHLNRQESLDFLSSISIDDYEFYSDNVSDTADDTPLAFKMTLDPIEVPTEFRHNESEDLPDSEDGESNMTLESLMALAPKERRYKSSEQDRGRAQGYHARVLTNVRNSIGNIRRRRVEKV